MKVEFERMVAILVLEFETNINNKRDELAILLVQLVHEVEVQFHIDYDFQVTFWKTKYVNACVELEDHALTVIHEFTIKMNNFIHVQTTEIEINANIAINNFRLVWEVRHDDAVKEITIEFHLKLEGVKLYWADWIVT